MTIDQNSAEWLEIKRVLEERLAMHERNVKIPGLPMDQTEGHRFAIVELEFLLNPSSSSKMAIDRSDESQ